mgnify:CR=1 FL=1
MADRATAQQAERIADRLLADVAAQVRPWLIQRLDDVLNGQGGDNGNSDESDALAAAWASRHLARQRKSQREQRTRTPRSA